MVKRMEVNVRLASLDDVGGIVKIHQAAFDSFFLTTLGEQFLVCYYTAFVKSDKGVVFCAEKEGCMVGFSACSYISRGFNSGLIKKNLFRFSCEAIRLLFINPKAVIRLVKNLNKESSDSAMSDIGQYAELFSIAVRPKYHGKGIGRSLLEATENKVKEYNNQMSLTTDYFDNDKTIAFYRALGYRNLYEFVAYPDRRMWRLIKDL